MAKCAWCGRVVGEPTIVAFWYCSEKCRLEARDVGGHPDVTTIIKGIVSLFGKGIAFPFVFGKRIVSLFGKCIAFPFVFGKRVASLLGNGIASLFVFGIGIASLFGKGKKADVSPHRTAKQRFRINESSGRQQPKRRSRRNRATQEAKRDAILRKQANVTMGPESDGTADANATSGDILQQIEKLGEMLTKGYITQEEFDEKKADLLKRL